MIVSEPFTAKDDQGFTLLEVMVAMAVMAIVLATLFRLQSSTIGLSGAAQFKRLAPVLAQQQLSALEQNGFEGDDLPKAFEGSWAGYTWSWEVENGNESGDWEDSLSTEVLNGLKKIQITIFSPDQSRKFNLVTWRYRHEE